MFTAESARTDAKKEQGMCEHEIRESKRLQIQEKETIIDVFTITHACMREFYCRLGY